MKLGLPALPMDRAFAALTLIGLVTHLTTAYLWVIRFELDPLVITTVASLWLLNVVLASLGHSRLPALSYLLLSIGFLNIAVVYAIVLALR